MNVAGGRNGEKLERRKSSSLMPPNVPRHGNELDRIFGAKVSQPRDITIPEIRYDWYCFDTANVTACACPIGPDGTAEQCQQVTGRQIPMNEQHEVHRLRPNRVGGSRQRAASSM